jgi:DNA gyrase/topoisomerase IV subunit A
MQFDVPTDLRMVLPALPGSLMLSDRQVQAILNNRLHRFTNRERQECLDGLRSLVDSITGARK